MTSQLKRCFTMTLPLAAGCGPDAAQPSVLEREAQALTEGVDIDTSKCQGGGCG